MTAVKIARALSRSIAPRACSRLGAVLGPFLDLVEVAVARDHIRLLVGSGYHCCVSDRLPVGRPTT